MNLFIPMAGYTHIKLINTMIELKSTTIKKSKKILDDLYFNYHSTPKKLLKKQLPISNYLLIKKENTIIGMSSYKELTPTLVSTERTILYPKYRGKGFGKLASKKIVDFLTQKGYHKIHCEVLTFNTKMLKIKIDQGFVVEGLMKDHDDLGIDCYTLGLQLNKG